MLNEAVVDLVGGASDARADRRSDMGAARAEAFHRVQRRIGDPGERALPARVRGADDAGLAVGEKHGHAVGGQYAEQDAGRARDERIRSEEHTSELQSLMRISYAVFCLKKKNINITNTHTNTLHLITTTTTLNK